MNNSIQMILSRKEINRVRPFIQAAFPNYKGFKVTLKFTDQPILCDDSMGGGSYDRFVLLHSSGAAKPLPRMTYGRAVHFYNWQPVPDELLVEHSMFCGKDVGITLYFHTSQAPKFIPAAQSA